MLPVCVRVMAGRLWRRQEEGHVGSAIAARPLSAWEARPLCSAPLLLWLVPPHTFPTSPFRYEGCMGLRPLAGGVHACHMAPRCSTCGCDGWERAGTHAQHPFYGAYRPTHRLAKKPLTMMMPCNCSTSEAAPARARCRVIIIRPDRKRLPLAGGPSNHPARPQTLTARANTQDAPPPPSRGGPWQEGLEGGPAPQRLHAGGPAAQATQALQARMLSARPGPRDSRRQEH